MPRLGAAQPLDKQLLLQLPAVQPSRRRLLLEELQHRRQTLGGPLDRSIATCDIGRVDGTMAGQRQQQRSTDAEEIGKRQRPQLQRQHDGGLTDLVGEE